MVTVAPFQMVIFDCDGFALNGVLAPERNWCEFEVVSGGVSLGELGGYLWPEFIVDFLSILEKGDGIRLSTIPKAAFTDIVESCDAEYLGNVPLSGYNTFFVFRNSKNSIQIVLANATGNVLAHTQCGMSIVSEFRQQLKKRGQ